MLKRLSFGLLALIILLLIVATIIDKFYGAEFASKYIYTSSATIVLWLALTVSGLVLIVKRGVTKRIVVLALHLSFVLILSGAFITHVFGKQGRVHLRLDDAPVESYILTDGESADMPFNVSLKSFDLKYYKGSSAAMDYVSVILIDGEIEGTVSMNNIFKYGGYRFYQSSYDSDKKGTILSVAYDPYGIAVTYTGYAVLLIAMIAFFFQKKSYFKTVLKSPVLRKTMVIAMAIQSFAAFASEHPSTLPRQTAEAFGDLYVYYNDRICPMQTLARDFTIKLYGKATYKGLSSEQVLAGWFFYYDEWKTEPMIKVKGKNTKSVLGIETGYASLADFVDINGFKIENALQNEQSLNRRRDLEDANDKFNIISMVCTGAMLKIYPYKSGDDVTWFSLADRLPSDMPTDEWIFVRRSMDFVAEYVAMQDYDKVAEFLGKIKKYQEKSAKDDLPSDTKFDAEKVYNSTNVNRPLAMACVALGIILFICYCGMLVTKKMSMRKLGTLMWILMICVFLYLTFRIILRWYVSGHIPLSNGFETMQFMAWVVALLTVLFRHKFAMALPFGYLLSGLTMMVSMFGEANPQITHLMPVLQSPLLSIHVMVIMVAYSLLAFVMMNGITALVLYSLKKTDSQSEIEYLQALSQLMIYPAVFLLTAGIFIGAVWANVSWGRYWGWDPKEVWALITMLVYSFALHSSLFERMRHPLFFHVYSVLAFLSVIITYFGVNFFMEGMHSYA